MPREKFKMLLMFVTKQLHMAPQNRFGSATSTILPILPQHFVTVA
jgi:hypothetical protein